MNALVGKGARITRGSSAIGDAKPYWMALRGASVMRGLHQQAWPEI